MGMLAWILGILGGLCAIMGVITAPAVIEEYFDLTWEFWLMIAGILFLASIASALGRGTQYE